MSATVARTGYPLLPPVTGPFTVEIQGQVSPAEFAHLEDALAALWGSLRVLPLGYEQASTYEDFLTGPGAVDNVRRLLADPYRHGKLELTFTMAGEKCAVTIRTAQAA